MEKIYKKLANAINNEDFRQLLHLLEFTNINMGTEQHQILIDLYHDTWYSIFWIRPHNIKTKINNITFNENKYINGFFE